MLRDKLDDLSYELNKTMEPCLEILKNKEDGGWTDHYRAEVAELADLILKMQRKIGDLR